MAVTFGSGGTSSGTGVSSASVAYPASVSAGQLICMIVICAYDPNYITTPSGWTFIGKQTGGAGAAGAGSGTRTVGLFVKEGVGTEGGTSQSISASGTNLVFGRMFTMTKGATESWVFDSFSGGSDDTDGTSVSMTSSGTLSLQAGDYLMCILGMNETTPTYSGQTISAISGITLGTVTEHMDAGSGIGDDVKTVLIGATVNSGAAVATVTVNTTATAAVSGACLFVRFRGLPKRVRTSV
jgi:hypothetical protein